MHDDVRAKVMTITDLIPRQRKPGEPLYAPGARTVMEPFLSPKLAALAACRPEHTIWCWYRRGQIASACDVASRGILVRVEDAVARSRESEIRYGKPEHAQRRRGRVA